MMISVIVPTLNSAGTLAGALEGLIPAAVHGLVREVIIADGGSSDQTLRIADGVGADTVQAGPSRASRLIAGAQRAKFPWLLFIEADGTLEPGWERDVELFIGKVERESIPNSAAVFRYAIEAEGFGPRAVEWLTNACGGLLSLAYAEQGLLVPRQLYAELGGFKPSPIFEDIDFTRRIGRRRLVRLKRPLAIAPARFRESGYLGASLRHAGCLALFGLNVPLERIAGNRSTGPAEAAGM